MTFLTGQIFLLLIKGGQTCKRTVYVCEWPTLQTTTTTSSAVNSAWTVNRNWTWIKHEKKEKFLFLHSTPFFPSLYSTHTASSWCNVRDRRAGTWCVTSLFLYMTSSDSSFSLYGGFLCVTVQYLYHLVAANCRSQNKKMHWAIFSSLDTIETSPFRFFEK